MPRIAYFMHVPWNWARQRPHLAAEGLAHHHAVDVFLPADTPRLPAAAAPAGPTLCPYRNARAFFRTEAAAQVARYDLLWFCSPQGFSTLAPALAPGQRVVYDCMDEFLAFPHIAAGRTGFARALADEVELVARADLIFCSSHTLARRLRTRYRPPAPLRVVHNAAEIADDPGDTAARDGNLKRIVYAGTVSRWFDFPIVLDGLEQFPGTQVDLYGPADVAIPAHPRLRHHGQQPHPRLHGLLRAADLLVMPFVVDDLIEAVNPVKLYEYIHAGVPAAAVRYGESESFARYIHLYRGADEYRALLQRLVAGRLRPVATPVRARAFVAAHTWARRQQAWLRGVAELLRRPRGGRIAPAHLADLRRHLDRAASHVESLEADLRRRDARLELLERARARRSAAAALPLPAER